MTFNYTNEVDSDFWTRQKIHISKRDPAMGKRSKCAIQFQGKVALEAAKDGEDTSKTTPGYRIHRQQGKCALPLRKPTRR